MAGKIARYKLGYLTITAVFRHQWDSPKDIYHNKWEFKPRALGIWWKTSSSLMVGLNLIWAKCWIDFGWEILTLKIDKHEETSSTLA